MLDFTNQLVATRQRFISRVQRWVIGAALLAHSAWAAEPDFPYDFPTYASDAACYALFSATLDDSRRKEFVAGCIAKEQEARDRLRFLWRSASKEIKEKCQNSSKTSYSMLSTCIAGLKRAEEKAASAPAAAGSH